MVCLPSETGRTDIMTGLRGRGKGVFVKGTLNYRQVMRRRHSAGIMAQAFKRSLTTPAMTHTASLLLLLLSYLFGSLPIGLLVGRMVKNIDVRDYGSGNIGASNVWRTMGPVWGTAVFLFDFCKGYVPRPCMDDAPVPRAPRPLPSRAWMPVAVGPCGHSSATTSARSCALRAARAWRRPLGVVYGLSPEAAIIGFAAWGLCLLATRYISVSSMLGAVVTSGVLIALHHDPPHLLFAFLVAFFVLFKHRANVARIKAGTEPKVGQKTTTAPLAPEPAPAAMTTPSSTNSGRLILASTSPRRRELLGLLGLPFEVVGSDFDEDAVSPDALAPPDYVTTLARGKALEVAGRTEGDALVIGADTTVTVGGRYLNKPADAEDARRMLRTLSGRTHQVYTGLCLVPVQEGHAQEPVLRSRRRRRHV